MAKKKNATFGKSKFFVEKNKNLSKLSANKISNNKKQNTEKELK